MRSGVTHQYFQDGTYTIRLTATSGDASETATLDVAVLNRAPRVLGIQSLELPSAEAMVELSTEAQDTPEDLLEVRWDFGDGEMDAGTDLWTTTHAYDEPGTYQVVVEVSDDQDALQADTIELEVGRGQGQALPEDAVEQGRVLTESVLRASVGGVVGADLEADVRSTMGLYLMRLSNGMCRLTFTAWDDANLAQVVTWVDLSGIPEEGGRIRWGSPPVYVTFHYRRGRRLPAHRDPDPSTALGRAVRRHRRRPRGRRRRRRGLGIGRRRGEDRTAEGPQGRTGEDGSPGLCRHGVPRRDPRAGLEGGGPHARHPAGGGAERRVRPLPVPLHWTRPGALPG